MKIKDVENKAEKYGATVEVDDYNPYDQSYLIEVIAPDGKAWNGNTQILAAYYFRYIKGSKADACRDLIERMNYGLEDYEE